MPSPFPGMDPYLESHWGDVHTRLITYASDTLQKVLPADLRARVEERVFVESPTGPDRQIIPDVQIVEHPRRHEVAKSSSSDVAVAEPLIVHLDEPVDEPTTERFIEIREAGSGGRVITVIEVLSPTNKRSGDGRESYRQKQRELRISGVSLVEIDLLRFGQRVSPVAPESLPPSHRTPYLICVRRGWQAQDIEVYGVSLREPLPVIAVPLRESDEDVPLDVQRLLNDCYDRGGYDDLDYGSELELPFEKADADWIEALLKERGLR